MNVPSLLEAPDDPASSPTILQLLHTHPMDRRALPIPPGHEAGRPAPRPPMPSVDEGPPRPPMPSVDDAPRIARYTSLAGAAAASGAFPSFAAAEAMHRASRAWIEPPEMTQPSRRRKAEVSAYRRLAIALAIGLAFAAGIASTLAFELAWRTSLPALPAVHVPRDAVTRTEALAVGDANGKLTSAAMDEAKQAKPRARRPARAVAATGEEPVSEPPKPKDDPLGDGL